MFIVELEDNCWIADWDGDPGRTVVKENAKTFKTEKEAEKALRKALKFRDFQNSKVSYIGLDLAKEGSKDITAVRHEDGSVTYIRSDYDK